MMEEIQQPKIQFVTQLIEGEFPDYEAIIPTKSSLAAVFLRKNLLIILNQQACLRQKQTKSN